MKKLDLSKEIIGFIQKEANRNFHFAEIKVDNFIKKMKDKGLITDGEERDLLEMINEMDFEVVVHSDSEYLN